LNAATSEMVVEEPVEEPDSTVDEKEGGACYFDPSSGRRSCE